jgi:hypothetical protein
MGEPHFNADGHFIHRCCKCGDLALFGVGVNLRKDKLGTWFCAQCKPQAQQSPEEQRH